MANDLDEVTSPVNDEGRDVNVINKQIKVEVGVGSKIFELALWLTGPIIGLTALWQELLPKDQALILIAVGALPGLFFCIYESQCARLFAAIAAKNPS